MKELVLIPLLSFLSLFTFAQQESMLTHFTTDELSGDVILSWQIKAGRTCNGIVIYRSTNGSNFKEVGEIVGVCGSSLEPVNYTFVDENPEANIVNYYRLDLGGYGNSETVERKIVDFTDLNYSLQPNPVVGQSQLFFDNSQSREHTLTIYDLTGKVLDNQITSSNSFKVNSSNINKGICFFTITSEGNQKLSGKFVVQ